MRLKEEESTWHDLRSSWKTAMLGLMFAAWHGVRGLGISISGFEFRDRVILASDFKTVLRSIESGRSRAGVFPRSILDSWQAF